VVVRFWFGEKGFCMKNVDNSNAVLSSLVKTRARLAESERSASLLSQFGINMVDLMMWLVIAALLLAAALQGIAYYQQAAWTYQAKSDVASVRTYMEAQFTMNNNRYPSIAASDNAGLSSSNIDLKLSSDNKIATARIAGSASGWTATLLSGDLHRAGKADKFFNFGSKNDPTTTWDDTSNNIPASSVQNQTILSD
jgi:Tfp pilus assembly protein PilE